MMVPSHEDNRATYILVTKGGEKKRGQAKLNHLLVVNKRVLLNLLYQTVSKTLSSKTSFFLLRKLTVPAFALIELGLLGANICAPRCAHSINLFFSSQFVNGKYVIGKPANRLVEWPCSCSKNLSPYSTPWDSRGFCSRYSPQRLVRKSNGLHTYPINAQLEHWTP